MVDSETEPLGLVAWLLSRPFTRRAVDFHMLTSVTLVVLGGDELAICRVCYEAAAHFGRLGGGHPVLFDLELLP